jgi:hypothetical protein
MKKMYFVKIFFCLFCNFRGSKPTRTRTQNREKQRSGLTITDNFLKFCVHKSRNVGAIQATRYYDTWTTDWPKTLQPHNFVGWGIKMINDIDYIYVDLSE